MSRLVSIIIPCYNSLKTLPYVIRGIQDAFEEQEDYKYQIILVNDGSRDDTWGVIRQLCVNNEDIIGINLSKNYGQVSAKMAGLPYATGDILVYMDDDGQHPYKGVLQLAKKIDEGWDVVYALFPHKQHNLFKILTSKIHASILTKTIHKPKTLAISSFFAINAFVAHELKKYQSPFPSMLGFILQITNKMTNISLPHFERREGKSGYTLNKMIALWLNGFTGFSIVPLRVASFAGAVFSLIGFLGGFIIVIHKLLNPGIAAGYTSLMAGFLFIGGIIMLMIGLLGEYIGRIFMTLSNMPQYVIKRLVNADNLHDFQCEKPYEVQIGENNNLENELK